jgi:hypothetical protein
LFRLIRYFDVVQTGARCSPLMATRSKHPSSRQLRQATVMAVRKRGSESERKRNRQKQHQQNQYPASCRQPHSGRD